MTDYTKTEISVGAFMIAGLAVLAYLSVSLGGLELFAGDRYAVKARFANVGDLSEDSAVRLAGVKVGRVEDIRLDNYAAEVVLGIDENVGLPADTIASIRTEGLLGKSFVSLSPGGAEEMLAPGGRIQQTEPSIDIFDIISKYAFGRDEDAPEQSPIADPLE